MAKSNFFTKVARSTSQFKGSRVSVATRRLRGQSTPSERALTLANRSKKLGVQGEGAVAVGMMVGAQRAIKRATQGMKRRAKTRRRGVTPKGTKF